MVLKLGKKKERKQKFLQALAVSVLGHGSTTWTLTKPSEKKLDGNYARILPAVLDMEATPEKTATVQPPTFHHVNHPSKMNKTC